MSDQAHAQEKNEVTENVSEAEVSKDERKWETVCNCCWASRGLEAEKIEAVYWLLVYCLLAVYWQINEGFPSFFLVKWKGSEDKYYVDVEDSMGEFCLKRQ